MCFKSGARNREWEAPGHPLSRTGQSGRGPTAACQKGQRRLLSVMEDSGCALLLPASCSKNWAGKLFFGTVFGLVTNQIGNAYHTNVPAS